MVFGLKSHSHSVCICKTQNIRIQCRCSCREIDVTSKLSSSNSWFLKLFLFSLFLDENLTKSISVLYHSSLDVISFFLPYDIVFDRTETRRYKKKRSRARRYGMRY
jgi:hypothetical protein